MVTISLIYHEIVDKNSWISPARMNNIITIAQLTPGPVSINSATFIGFSLGGLAGSIVATSAVLLPSLMIMTAYIIISSRACKILSKKTIHKLKVGLKPGIMALLIYAVFLFGSNSEIDPLFIILSIICFICLSYFKRVHPVVLFVLSGLIGIIAYNVSP